MMKDKTQRNIHYSYVDGMFAQAFATLTSGVFLTGLAIYLGMSDFTIGALASLPFWVTVFQLPVSFFIRKNGRRKKVACWASLLARLIWLLIMAVAIIPWCSAENKVLIILVLVFSSYTLASISYVSWLSWTSDLIPENILGRFFGTRNMLIGAAGMSVMLIFGKILDSQNDQYLGTLPVGFAIAFFSAILFGLTSLLFLRKISDPPQVETNADGKSFLRFLSLPINEPNFRRFLTFAFFWGFSVHFASPFFTLYFLRELKFSYGFVALLGTISALTDLLGMQFWGRISDRVKNKAVIQLAGWVAIFLPLAWAMVRSDSLWLPIILQVLGGGFWAGITLCQNNLLLRISRPENKTVFLSTFSLAGGMGAAIGPLLAGLFLSLIGGFDLHLFGWGLYPLQVIFISSTLLRLLSFQVFKKIHEPDEQTARDVIRVIRSMRGLNITNGFNGVLHPFITVRGKNGKNADM